MRRSLLPIYLIVLSSFILSIFSIFISIYSLHLVKYHYQHINKVLTDIEGKKCTTMHYPSFFGNYTPKEITIPIVAVTITGEGVVGYMHIRAIPGYGNVLIEANPFSEIDLQYSLEKAVNVAKIVTKQYSLPYDFIFSYEVGDAKVIGGESAGAAATLGIIALLENRSIRNDTVITGTVELNGDIGRVGGIFEKARAAAEQGYKIFLLPEGQSTLTYYERVTEEKEIMPGYYVYKTSYIPKKLNLKEYAKEEWGMEVIEVKNIYDAMHYMLK